MNHPFPQQTAWETKSRSMQGCIFSYADVGKNVIMSQNQLNLDREKAEAREATARAADETEEIEAPSKSSLSNISSPQSVGNFFNSCGRHMCLQIKIYPYRTWATSPW